MIRTERASLAKNAAVLVSFLVLVCLSVGAAQAVAETTIHYTKESLPEYEQQLASGQITAATINKRVGSVRLTLKNGQHYLVHYKAHTEPTVAAALAARGVTVAVLAPSEAQKEAAKMPVHHKLRYIAGGILIVVIVIVGAVLLVDRKRKRAEE